MNYHAFYIFSEQEYEYILMNEMKQKNVFHMCVLVHPILTQTKSNQIPFTYVLEVMLHICLLIYH